MEKVPYSLLPSPDLQDFLVSETPASCSPQSMVGAVLQTVWGAKLQKAAGKDWQPGYSASPASWYHRPFKTHPWMGPVNWPEVVDDAPREQLHQDGGMMERLCFSVSFRQGYRRQEPAVWSSRAWYRSATFPLLTDLSSISLSAWITKDPAALALLPTLCFPQWAVLLQLAGLLAGRTRPLLSQRRSVAFSSQNQTNSKCQCPTNHRGNLSP